MTYQGIVLKPYIALATGADARHGSAGLPPAAAVASPTSGGGNIFRIRDG